MNENEEKLFPTPCGPQWKTIGVKNHHGINIPLFSIHSSKSAGIGDFLDLIPLIDWCQEVGLDVIQLLPLNDSGPDPSPYNAQSMYALHPIYIRLDDNADFLSLNETKHVDYHVVLEKKLAHLRAYFNAIDIDLSAFIKEHEWVKPYALFKVLKEEFSGKGWMHWPECMREPTPALYATYKVKMEFYIYLQYLCIKQLSYVKQYADSKGVFIKGDIPILISPDSVEVWENQHLFDMNYAAGAPPDVFTAEGQYWGFPIYNWDAIEKENFAIWKKRLELATHFYHIYRIDHIIGFFRLWIIPRGKNAKEGRFEPHEKEAMLKQGEHLLTTLIHSSPMLPIGEDLGVIPPEVNLILESLGICGTKVFRWEREYEGDKHFIPYFEFNPINMSSVSTHDSETLELWWEHFTDEAKAYCDFKEWNYHPKITKNQRIDILREAHHNPTLFHINLLQEYLALIPELTWDDPQDERINIPGYVLPTNWTYRYKKPLEELLSSEEFKSVMRAIIQP